MFLKIENLKKSFASQPILRGIGLGLDGGTFAILGRSGCGKTTFLKIIAGLLPADQGQIFLENEDISQKSAQQRGIVYIYQEPLLFPHLTVFENVAFGLRLRKMAGSEVQKKTMAMLDELELAAHAQKMPTEISGGQRQRVAFGRALIVQPKLLLLDEPFGSLDSETRAAMQAFFKKMAEKHQISSIFVTHDLKEAVLMGDKLGLMEDGRLDIFENFTDFVHDERTGMGREIGFWKALL